MAIKMKTALQIIGYNINHKKVYRLMKEAQLLQENIKKPSKTKNPVFQVRCSMVQS
jgi:hypothetical protein